MIKIILRIFFVFFIQSSFANDEGQGLLNKLLAPGPLITGHKELEKVDCLSCHDAGKGVPNQLCLNCHKEIKESINLKNSFHGIKNLKQNCIECHLDHKGRNYDSTIVDQKKFSHDETGYILTGKHKKINCIDCHTEKREKMAVRKSDIHFFGKTSSCISCHKKDDVHLFKDDFAKKDCNFCHNDLSWKEVKNFDHDKVSKFKLEGKHAEMKCFKCHNPNGEKTRPAIYKWEDLDKSKCLSCHKDVHKETLSDKFKCRMT